MADHLGLQSRAASLAKSVGSQIRVRTFLPDKLARYLTEDATRLTPEGTPRSARTLNRTKATLRLLFRYLYDTGAITRDPSRVLRNAHRSQGTCGAHER